MSTRYLPEPGTVLYVASSQDQALAAELEKHLRILKQQNALRDWSRSIITPETRNVSGLEEAMHKATVILPLISPDFLATDICHTFLRMALQYASEGKKSVVPILLRHVLFEHEAFARLVCLPRQEKFITTWENQDEAFVEIARELRALLVQDHPPASDGPFSRPFEELEKQVNRERLLTYISEFWINHILKSWLGNITFIQPDLHELPGAIDNPWRAIMPMAERSERPFPPGTTLLDVYDQAEGSLLLLGAPGSGKTTLLLVLLRQLIERAREQPHHPLPVLFNLASGAKVPRSLQEWLSNELLERYLFESAPIRNWMQNRQILPLIDGFDTLPAELRPTWIKLINEYRFAYPAQPLVICSRSAVYLEQPGRLRLRRATIIQPFTETQVDRYLSDAGQVAELRAAFLQDKTLYTLAKTPLLLSILVKIRQNPFFHQQTSLTPAELRYALCDTYVEQMLTQHEKSPTYQPGQVQHWLTWMAQQMERHNQIMFSPLDIQPDWLPGQEKSLIYYASNVLIGAIFSGIGLGLVGNIIGGQSFALIAALTGGMVGGIGFALVARKVRQVQTARRRLLKSHLRSLLFSLVLWFILLLTYRASGLAGAFTSLVLLLAPLPLLIGTLLREEPQTLLEKPAIGVSADSSQRSMKNGIQAGLLIGGSFGLLVATAQFSGLLKAEALNYWFLALILGLFLWLIFGGLATLQTWGLHRLLYRSGLLPSNHTAFLQYAHRHLLLSKAGDNYMFRYPLLQEYFASLSLANSRECY